MKQTDELKKLIAEHPDYPIVFLSSEEANTGDYYWMYCSNVSFGVGEMLAAECPYNDEVICCDRDEFEEEMQDWLCNKLDENLTDEEFDKRLKKEIAKYDDQWINVITVWVSN